MTAPLSEEVLEGLRLEAEHKRANRDGLMVLPRSDLEALLFEVMAAREGRAGYRQGLEDALEEANAAIKTYGAMFGPAAYFRADAARTICNRILDRIARLSVDAGQGSEHVSQEQSQEAGTHDEDGEA